MGRAASTLSGPPRRYETLLTRVAGAKSCGCVVEKGLPVCQFSLTVRGGIGSICYAGWSLELWAELVAVSIGSEGETDFPAVTASGGDGDSRENHGFEAAAHKF